MKMQMHSMAWGETMTMIVIIMVPIPMRGGERAIKPKREILKIWGERMERKHIMRGGNNYIIT